jgi:hypothetical protein
LGKKLIKFSVYRKQNAINLTIWHNRIYEFLPDEYPDFSLQNLGVNIKLSRFLTTTLKINPDKLLGKGLEITIGHKGTEGTLYLDSVDRDITSHYEKIIPVAILEFIEKLKIYGTFKGNTYEF